MKTVSDYFVPWNKVSATGDRGIGLGAAEALDSAGREISISCVSNPDGARQTCERLAQEFNIRAHPILADVADPRSARSFVREAARLMGGTVKDIEAAFLSLLVAGHPMLTATPSSWMAAGWPSFDSLLPDFGR